MRIIVGRQSPSVRPAATLRRDNWDDYTFKTLYWARLWLASGREVDLGAVKILRHGMGVGGGRVDVGNAFETLSSDYCSLGQQPSYYEALLAADAEEPGVAADYLSSMRDATFSPPIYDQFKEEPGFETSLLRDGSARQALELGLSLWTGANRTTVEGQLGFDYILPGATEPFAFHFGESDALPTRIFAVTGYNGVGKTRLLASLGMVAATHGQSGVTPLAAEYGRLQGDSPDISAVVCISYSAFDDFEVPRISEEATADARLGRAYHYVGLRRPDSPGGSIGRTLKSIDEIDEEFAEARERALNKMRGAQLEQVFAPLAREPSFSMGGGLPGLDASRSVWDEAVRRFSTGHKIVLNIVVQLCAILERRSLVLLDEPEMHLHPPLVAALLQSVGVALQANDSFAVVATHSPVVAQEIPGRNVIILRRAQQLATWEDPEIETYGEHIGILTSRIFNLDNSSSDFRGRLRELAADMTLDEIEALFDLGLSAQARVIVMSDLQRAS